MGGVTSVLVANRGEVAVRVLRACADLGLRGVAVASEDDATAVHARRGDDLVVLPGTGPAAYLDPERLAAAAAEAGCDAVHPGWGFLSEDARFATACREAGLTFVGPSPEVLAALGDKAAARALAASLGVPVLRGSDGPTDLAGASAVLASLGDGGALLVKAVAGGGGRGMRVVRRPEDLAEAWERCASEAQGAFGDGRLYVEQLLPRARHVEVQVLGDGTGGVAVLGERECSVQRRHQKLLELAPAPGLDPEVREQLVDAALRIARHLRYAGAGTIELLVDADAYEGRPAPVPFAFMEANARLQVEHTVTEQVTGVDLVQAQLRIAAGATLADLGLRDGVVVDARGAAVQARISAEVLQPDGTSRPAGGVLAAFEPPTGPGIRVDHAATAGWAPNPRFDAVIAKVVAWAPDLPAALGRLDRALGELRTDGVATTAPVLRAVARHADVAAGRWTTTWFEDRLVELLEGAPVDDRAVSPAAAGAEAAPSAVAPPGTLPLVAPLIGTVVEVAAEGDLVAAGAQVAVLESMKMEHVVTAPVAGIVRLVAARPGETVLEGVLLVALEPDEAAADAADAVEDVDPDRVRPDLAEVLDRHAIGLDDARPDAVERRRRTGSRTARENLDDLVDPGSFVEYGPLVIAAQRRRRPLQDLIERTPADGLVGGIATVNAPLVGEDRARCVVASYDYTVLAGTQGTQNHRKKDRLFEVAEAQQLPVVLLAEGGGGRPGDTDGTGVSGLDTLAFQLFARLSGQVPLVGIASGRCFAGNAALLGCCDVVIATEGSTIGMGGPAMIEGGGLGIVTPDEVGPLHVHVADGVVDVAVRDEAEAVDVAKRYLSYFQGPVAAWEAPDQRLLRHAIPENRLRVYEVRDVLDLLADVGSVLELRRGFGLGMVTALVRVEGRPIGVVANDPRHLGGAIDSDGADKASRFLQLCDAHGVPVLFLCDTPGIMVGPAAEATGTVRHASRMFVTGASMTVPHATVILRKAYGLGAQAMAAGTFKAPDFVVSWPTGEVGGMGLEGAVRLGYRKELEAVEDPAAREALFREMVDRMYEHGKAINAASHFELDDVIDPADTRRWITTALGRERRERKPGNRPFVDTW